MLIALPDILGSFLAQTQNTPLTLALSGGRISGGRPRTKSGDDPTGWVMPTFAVVYILVAGPAITRAGRVPFKSQNIQVDCYGPDLRTAGEMYRTWYAEFYSPDIFTPTGFIAAHCAISSLEELSSPLGLYGGENVWPRVTSTHLVKYLEVPV